MRAWVQLWVVGLVGVAVWVAEAGRGDEPLGFAVSATLEEFLGEPVFVPMQQLWTQRGGWGGVLTAPDGTVLAFRSPGGGEVRRSHDGGTTWN